MPKKSDLNQSDKAPLTNIVQLPLLPEWQPQLKAFMVGEENFLADLDKLVEDGWAFTIERNKKRKNYGCLAKCQDIESEDAGVGFYSNAPTPTEALMIACFKLLQPRQSSIADMASRIGGDTSYS